MYCLIAVEEKNAGIIKNNLSKMAGFSGWIFDTCTDAVELKGYLR